MSEETPIGRSRSRKSKRTANKRTSPKREPRIDKEQEQVLKFLIGLRLLGEKKSQRFLAYMRSLQESSENGQSSSKKEG